MSLPTCARCGRPIDLSGDAWRLLPGGRYEHLSCPISPEMRSLPPAAISPNPFPGREGTGAPAPGLGPLSRFLTMEEAADFLRVSKATIRGKIRAGELPAQRLKGGQTVLLEVRHVLALLEPYTAGESPD